MYFKYFFVIFRTGPRNKHGQQCQTSDEWGGVQHDDKDGVGSGAGDWKGREGRGGSDFLRRFEGGYF